MREFICGMLVEDDRVMWRQLDLMCFEEIWHIRLPMKHFFKQALLGCEGCVSCDTALSKIQDMKVAIAEYERFFETVKEITPEWLKEHSEEIEGFGESYRKSASFTHFKLRKRAHYGAQEPRLRLNRLVCRYGKTLYALRS